MDNIFYRVLLKDQVKVEPKVLGKGFREHIFKKIKMQNEGMCTRHGYIRENSIDIQKIAPGVLDKVGLNGHVVFEVHYMAEVCNPLLGNVVRAKVVNVNKFGILAEVAPILEIIIAKNSVHITSDPDVDLDAVKPGDWIYVEIMGKKFELNDRKISIIGRVVKGAMDVQQAPKSKAVPGNVLLEAEDVEDEEVIAEEGEEDEDGATDLTDEEEDVEPANKEGGASLFGIDEEEDVAADEFFGEEDEEEDFTDSDEEDI